MLEHLSVDGILARVPSNYVAAVVGTGWTFFHVFWAKDCGQMSVIEQRMSKKIFGCFRMADICDNSNGSDLRDWFGEDGLIITMFCICLRGCVPAPRNGCRCMGGISFCVRSLSSQFPFQASSRIWWNDENFTSFGPRNDLSFSPRKLPWFLLVFEKPHRNPWFFSKPNAEVQSGGRCRRSLLFLFPS